MHKATIQGQADQRAAFVGGEHCCSYIKVFCAVPNQRCLGQIQATLCSVGLFANLAVALTSLTQLLLAIAWGKVHCLLVSIKAHNRLKGNPYNGTGSLSWSSCLACT